MAVLAQLGGVGTIQGGITSQTQPPYILTHFPGCENSHQGAGRREEQVAAAAETLRALRYSPWEELFVLGLSAVCWEGSRNGMPHVLGPPASRVSPGGETGNVTSSHRPPHGRGPERSQHSPGRETKACGGSSHDTGARRLARTCHCVPTSLERALWISAILTSVRDFSKLHKDALGPDTAPGA